jgi:hypothetical protein
MSYIITPPPLSEEQIQLLDQLRIERFASFDEYMEIPGLEDQEEKEEQEDDDITIYCDDQYHRFREVPDIYHYDSSELCELDTVVLEYEDYFLSDNDMNDDDIRNLMEIDNFEEDEVYGEDYREYDYMASRIDRLMERF